MTTPDANVNLYILVCMGIFLYSISSIVNSAEDSRVKYVPSFKEKRETRVSSVSFNNIYDCYNYKRADVKRRGRCVKVKTNK